MMRYDDPQLLSVLAGEYVLGTLRGAARTRFERLMERDPALRGLVIAWQEKLAPLAEETPEVQPPARVFEALRTRMAGNDVPPRPRWWERLSFWRPAALANLALAAVLLAYIGLQEPAPDRIDPLQPVYVGVLSDAREQPAVAVLAYRGPWRLVIETEHDLAVPPGQELRLWVMERNGEHRFLARIPVEDREVRLSEEQWGILADAWQLVLSRNPADSAVTEPAGEILYTGPCLSLERREGG
ncbi:MAG: hypothetical protein JJU06_01435 [Ectothiorhodospiraceae bacterium]|nr:hypothetical protein [Ectothiorhodospiraceae bacterium]